MKHTISVLMKNESGVLSRLSNLFSSRGYRIESLTIAPSLDENYARATIVTIGDDAVIEQIIKQLNRLIPVISVNDLSENSSMILELAFFKIKTTNETKLIDIIQEFDAKIIDKNQGIYAIQIVCGEEKLKEFIETLEDFEIKNFVRSGAVSI